MDSLKIVQPSPRRIPWTETNRCRQKKYPPVSNKWGTVPLHRAEYPGKNDLHRQRNEDIVRIEDESRDLLKEKEEIEGDIAENESVIKTENDNIVRLKQVQKQSLEAAKKVEEKITDLQAWKEKLNASNKELFENHEKLNARITGLDKESVRLDNQKEKLDENFDSLTEYIWNLPL